MLRSRVIPCEELKIVWVDVYYDHPLAGLCSVDGRWWAFEWGFQEDEVTVTELRPWSRLRWWASKRLFEVCVGYHWTYGPQRREFDPAKQSTLLYNLYYPRNVWARWRTKAALALAARRAGQITLRALLTNLMGRS